MTWFLACITVFGLCLFEAISSIDNAIINADVMVTMQERARRWFLLWGLLFAVFLVRGLLPWVIVWGATPSLGPLGALTATFSNDPAAAEAIHRSAPRLLIGAGAFLVCLFIQWLFLEPKAYGLPGEQFFERQSVWFYAVISVLLTGLVWLAVRRDPLMAFGATVGTTAFFITSGFKNHAAAQERHLLDSRMSDFSKLVYLEVIDATFSVDGVLGAFAFTFSVPLIIIGNGLGAVVVRQLTMHSLDAIRRLRYLKNGAMYSILGLGTVMIVESFGGELPQWASPALTFLVIGYFYLKSRRALAAGDGAPPAGHSEA